MQFISMILFVYLRRTLITLHAELNGYNLIRADHPSNTKRGEVWYLL